MKLIISMLAMSLATGVAFADNTAVKVDAKEVAAEAADNVADKAAEKSIDKAVTVIEATTIALRGKPVYPPEFTHFDYVNP